MSEQATFVHDSYVVLDVPGPVGDQVKAIRRRHFYQLSVPVEITVAGSSGTGVISPSEEPSRVFAILDEIAATTAPIRTSYGNVLRFPGTEIFVFSLRSQAPFQELHERIRQSGLRFEHSPHPYFPHTTLRHRDLPGGRPVTEQESQELLRERIAEEFVLDTLSVYAFYATPDGQIVCPLLHRAKLSGTP